MQSLDHPHHPEAMPPQRDMPAHSTAQAARELEAILAHAASPHVSTARDTQGKLCAYPGGPPTQLPEKLWHIVRTPEFKQWAGDWEFPYGKSFTTSRGSTYQYEADGSITRHKVTTNETMRLGVAVFASLDDTERDTIALALHGHTPHEKIRIMERMPDDSAREINDTKAISNPEQLYIMVWNKNSGKPTLVKKASARPVQGSYVFDATQRTQADGTTNHVKHLGHQVTDIVASAPPTVLRDAHGEPLLLPLGNGKMGFVKMRKPLNTNNQNYFKEWQVQHGYGRASDTEALQAFLQYLDRNGYDGLTLNGAPMRIREGLEFIVDKEQQVVVAS